MSDFGSGSAFGGGGKASSAWSFAPPLAASLSLLSGDANNLVLTNDSDVGLLVDSGPVTGGPVIRRAFRTLTDKTKDWVLVVKVSEILTTASVSLINAGIYACDGVGGKMVSIVELFQSTSAFDFYEAQYWASGTAYSSSPGSFTSKSRGSPEFFKLERIGSNLVYSLGNGKQFIPVLTAGVTAHLGAAPDQIGIGLDMQRASGGNAYFQVPYFALTGPAV